jgi:hydrogenase nickel incorporation protein HypA/HybF
MSLVDAALQASSALGPARITAVHVRLGALSGVVEGALRFSFDLATDGTPIEGAALVIEAPSLAVTCEACGHRAEVAQISAPDCERCGTPVRIEGSRDLELVALEVINEPAADS